MAVTGTPPAERVLTMSRRRSAAMLAVAAVLVAVGVYWINAGFLPGWIVTAFFGYISLSWAAELVTPSTLQVNSTGFVVTRPLRRTYRRQWSQCSRFEPWGPTSSRRKPSVTYRTASNDKPLRRAASTLLWGSDEWLSAGLARLTARQLAELRNQYRDAAIGRQSDGPSEGDDRDAQPPAPPRRQRPRLINGALLALASALLVGAYFAYRVDGPAALWIPLAVAGAICLIAYAWRD